jgi:hypothetical protein
VRVRVECWSVQPFSYGFFGVPVSVGSGGRGGDLAVEDLPKLGGEVGEAGCPEVNNNCAIE